MVFGSSPKRMRLWGSCDTLIRMEELLKNLNPKQVEAVRTTDGPILILAGPGSGKTKTLTHRIAYLLARGVRPEEVLAVTFTNKAAREMKECIASLLAKTGTRAVMPFAGTFHSLAVRILRVHATLLGLNPRFTIFDDNDTLSTIKEVCKELEISSKQFPPGMLVNLVSGLKSELITPDAYAEDLVDGEAFAHILHRVYARYQEWLRESSAMDFDDLLLNICLLFTAHPDVLASYQRQYRYIHVDEYQDVNKAQYDFMHKLAGFHKNIAVVGDDAQAIYAFRGADYRNILNFEHDWPNAKVIVLDQNYRSTQMILDAARSVIGKNSTQKEKNLWTEKKGGMPLSLVPTENERAEAEFVYEKVQELIREGMPLSEIAVLYRTNAQSRAFEEAFLEHDFPYKIVGGIRFYQRKEIKDVLAFLRFLVNPRDFLSLGRIINIPPRGIGDKLWRAVKNDAPVSLRPQEQEKIASFQKLITQLTSLIKEHPAQSAISELLKTIRYKEYLVETATNAEERWENVEELVRLALRYNDLPPGEGIEKMLEDLALMAEEGEAPMGETLQLMTLHAAKGLEFRTIFIVGLEEGVFPHSRALLNPGELEEERRLCYVGLTRAKERVFLSFALRRAQFGSILANAPSRFISEIPEHLLAVVDESSGGGDILYY